MYMRTFSCPNCQKKFTTAVSENAANCFCAFCGSQVPIFETISNKVNDNRSASNNSFSSSTSYTNNYSYTNNAQSNNVRSGRAERKIRNAEARRYRREEIRRKAEEKAMEEEAMAVRAKFYLGCMSLIVVIVLISIISPIVKSMSEYFTQRKIAKGYIPMPNSSSYYKGEYTYRTISGFN